MGKPLRRGNDNLVLGKVKETQNNSAFILFKMDISKRVDIKKVRNLDFTEIEK